MADLGLVPLPSGVRALPDATPFPLDANATVAGEPGAVDELIHLVRARTGLDLREGPESSIRLRVTGTGPAESYRLSVTAASVDIEGSDAAGLFYGVQTLSQLLRREAGEWVVPAVEIEDAPRFAYRGVMLDVARHFFDVDAVKDYIDRATTLKFNHLHLHLTDDQGWRIEIASRPELTVRGSSTAVGGDTGGFFTAADYREIVRHAATRHMTVVPEIDGPGHTHVVGLAYPGLVADPVRLPDDPDPPAVQGEPYTGIAVGFSSLRIREGATYDFLSDVFGELAELTPGPYLHVGGDEALGTSPDDYANYIARVTALVSDLGKTPVAWHEAGAVPARAAGTVGQYWGFVEPDVESAGLVRSFAQTGARLILSPADAAYLDMKETPESPLGLTWAHGATSLERAYSWEPVEVLRRGGVPDAADASILGVEAPMWTETGRSLTDLYTLAFPRLAAAAEVAWSPVSGPERTWESFRQRVGSLAPLWRAAGIPFHRSADVPWTDAP